MYETLTHEVVISLTSSSQLKWIQSEDMTIGLVVSYAVCLFLPMRYCFFSSEMKDFLLVLLSSHVLGTHAGAKLQLSQFQSPTTESFDSNSGTRYCCYGFWQGRSECIWSLDITGWKILENQSITSPNTPNTLAGMFDPCFWPKDSRGPHGLSFTQSKLLEQGIWCFPRKSELLDEFSPEGFLRACDFNPC